MRVAAWAEAACRVTPLRVIREERVALVAAASPDDTLELWVVEQAAVQWAAEGAQAALPALTRLPAAWAVAAAFRASWGPTDMPMPAISGITRTSECGAVLA